MTGHNITLRFDAVCADRSCGALIPAGAVARWYGRGRVYGRGCHDADAPEDVREEYRERRYAELEAADHEVRFGRGGYALEEVS